MEFLKKFYTTKYQETVYEIQVAKAEYEKIGAFISIGLLLTAVVKLYLNVPTWFPLLFIPFATITAKFVGRYLIKLGVPKKTNDLVNQQNPALIKLLAQQEEILKRLK